MPDGMRLGTVCLQWCSCKEGVAHDDDAHSVTRVWGALSPGHWCGVCVAQGQWPPAPRHCSCCQHHCTVVAACQLCCGASCNVATATNGGLSGPALLFLSSGTATPCPAPPGVSPSARSASGSAVAVMWGCGVHAGCGSGRQQICLSCGAPAAEQAWVCACMGAFHDALLCSAHAGCWCV